MQSVVSAYQKTAKTTLTPRELEAQLLIRAASRLQAIKEGWPETRDGLSDALDFNRKLWTILATSATSRENPLPDTVKNNIGTLAVFIFKRILECYGTTEPTKLSILVSINREIAAGLSATPKVESPPTAP